MEKSDIQRYFDLLFYSLEGLYLDYKEETEFANFYLSNNLEDEESNYAVPKNPSEENFVEMIREIEKAFIQKNRMSSIFLYNTKETEYDEIQMKFKSILISQGYVERNCMAYLKTSKYKEDDIELPNDCEIFLVNEEKKYIDDYMDIYSECFLQECSEKESLLTTKMMLKTFEKHGKFQNYILVKNNITVAISSISISINHANLYNVATLKEYRKQNFSKMIMKNCLSKLQNEKEILIQSAYLDKYVLNIGFQKEFHGAMYVKEMLEKG